MKRKDLKTAQLLRAKHLTPEDKIRRASSTTPTELESTASPASNGSSTVSSSASAKAKTMPAQKLLRNQSRQTCLKRPMAERTSQEKEKQHRQQLQSLRYLRCLRPMQSSQLQKQPQNLSLPCLSSLSLLLPLLLVPNRNRKKNSKGA